MTRYGRGMDPSLIPVCGVCETRRVHVRSSGTFNATCGPCKAAQDALCRYWASIGTPLSWREPRRRKWLTVLRPRDVA